MKKTINQIAEELKSRYPETPQAAYESARTAAEQQLNQDISIVSEVLSTSGCSEELIEDIINSLKM